MNISALACHTSQGRPLNQAHPGPDDVVDEFDNCRVDDGPDAIIDEFDNSRSCHSDYIGFSEGCSYMGGHFLG